MRIERLIGIALLAALAAPVPASAARASRDDPAAPAAAEAPVAAPMLERVVVVGASASRGFMLDVGLADAIDAMVLAPHRAVADATSLMFFKSPLGSGMTGVDRARASRPSLAVGIDFLFWFGYGDLPTDEERMRRLEAGLELLERLDCPVVVSELPDMRDAVGVMLRASQIPSVEALTALNARIRAWAEKRGPKALLVPLPEYLDALRARRPFEIGGAPWPRAEEIKVLQPDRLHPNIAGLAALAALVGERLVAAHPDLDPRALQLDPAAIEQALNRLSDARRAKARAEREEVERREEEVRREAEANGKRVR